MSATTYVTLDQVLDLARRLSSEDKLRLIERLAPQVLQAFHPTPPHPSTSLDGILADLGPAPSLEDIAEVRHEMSSNFPRETDK